MLLLLLLMPVLCYLCHSCCLGLHCCDHCCIFPNIATASAAALVPLICSECLAPEYDWYVTSVVLIKCGDCSAWKALTIEVTEQRACVTTYRAVSPSVCRLPSVVNLRMNCWAFIHLDFDHSLTILHVTVIPFRVNMYVKSSMTSTKSRTNSLST